MVGVEPVLAIGTSRPGLAVEALRRGLYLVTPGTEEHAARAGVRFAGSPGRTIHGIPLLLVVEGGDAAVTAAIDGGAADAVPAAASDALIAARLAALVRRTTGGATLYIGELAIDRLAQKVTRAGCALDLLPREYRLLLHLAERAGRTVSRAELLQAVWRLGFDPGTNVVAVHVSRLRAKLDRGFAAPLLHTDPGLGYRLMRPF